MDFLGALWLAILDFILNITEDKPWRYKEKWVVFKIILITLFFAGITFFIFL